MNRLDIAILNFCRGIRYSVEVLWDGDYVAVSAIIDGMEPIVSPAFTSESEALDALASHIENITEGDLWLVR